MLGTNTGKYGPEKTPYLDTFHTVNYIVKSKALRLLVTLETAHTLRKKVSIFEFFCSAFSNI